jgi:hypothetical protein
MLFTTLSQVIVAKIIWDPKDLTTLKATPVQNASVNKKDIEDFQTTMDNLQIEVKNYSRVSMEKPFEGYT